MSLDLTPEPEEIVQAEDGDERIPPIPVQHSGPIQTRELPGVRGGYKTESANSTVAIRLLSLEPRRKAAVILPVDQDIWIGASQAAAQANGSSAYYVPLKTQFNIDHMDEVWAVAATSTALVSVATTYWSE